MITIYIETRIGLASQLWKIKTQIGDKEVAVHVDTFPEIGSAIQEVWKKASCLMEAEVK